MEEHSEGATPTDALQAMAEIVMQKDPVGNVPGRKDRDTPIYTVVYHATEDGRASWVEGAVASTLRMDPGTVRLVHEPYLVERGYLVVPRAAGRPPRRLGSAAPSPGWCGVDSSDRPTVVS